MTHSNWKQVWDGRSLDASRPTVLAKLLAADGMDTGFGSVAEEAWRHYVLESAALIGIDAQSSVFEVGCGAGAWLYEIGRMGCEIAGLDASPALIGYAREHLPSGTWSVGDAGALDVSPPYDFVVSSGVFLYFASLDYARNVLECMVRKARRGILILDIPDIAKHEAALAQRREMLGDESYRHRYAGLDHLYFDKAWFEAALESFGLTCIEIRDQHIDGYINSRYRFNVFGWLR